MKNTPPDKRFINTLRPTYCRMEKKLREYACLEVYRSYYRILGEIIHNDRRRGSPLAIAWTSDIPTNTLMPLCLVRVSGVVKIDITEMDAL